MGPVNADWPQRSGVAPSGGVHGFNKAIHVLAAYSIEYRARRELAVWKGMWPRTARQEKHKARWSGGTLRAVTASHFTQGRTGTGTQQREAQQARTGSAPEVTARIAELTRDLTAAVTARDVVEVVDKHILSLFGAVGVGIWAVEGGRVFAVGATGYSHEFLEWLERILPNQPHQPIKQALADRIPIFISSREESIRRYPQLAEVVVKSGKQAWAYLPLVVSGRTVGVCVISYDQPHTFTSEERTLITALSGLVAQALERARLYDTEHRRARELQRGLLPRTLPSLPAVTVAARYLPNGEAAEVGGDWYDVIALSGDRVALVVGDVMGHGLSEAVTMGRLRTAVCTLSDLELPPDELFFRLNEMISDLGDDLYATCLYAVYDPTSGQCSIARAGHPPPAVVQPDGSVRFPDIPLNPPLGAATPPFDTGTLELPESSLLVFYTDGLVESSTRDISQGMAHLARQLGGTEQWSNTADLERICDVLVAALVPEPRHTSDDVALLVARTCRSARGDIAFWLLPDGPVAAGRARGYVREQLTAWGLDELLMATELIVSELVGNVVRHAKGPVALRLLRSRTLICEVSDGSLSMPRIRRALETDEGGRGLYLIAAVADRWGARYTPTGKSIWTEQHLPIGS